MTLIPAAAGRPEPEPALQPKTVAAFDRYVQLTEARIGLELNSGGAYLWVDAQSARRAQLLARLRQGEVVIEPLETKENGKAIACPDGLIHHWVGSVFVPGVTLEQYLAFVQQYDRHQEFYQPDVARSRLLERNGDDFKVLFRFYKKKVITAVHDSDHDIRYFRLTPARGGSRTRTTRIQEVENHGESNERLLPEGNDRGYLWRLYTWWRFEERDGGVYVECESVSLTRDIPTGLGWLVGPFVKSIPRESLQHTLGTTRRVLARGKF
jgi:hypothetical protein